MLERIAIIKNSVDAYSESFIDAHIKLLPYDKHILGDQRPPRKSLTTGESFTISSQNSFKRIFFRLLELLSITSKEKYQEKAIKRYLLRHNIQLVLAEYGNTGATMTSICKDAKIPLVVHFHGYDAYKFDLLEKNKRLYDEMFLYAQAIIVVSHDMKEQLIKLGAPPSKVFYNVYGVDITKFSLSNSKKNSPFFLAVGRFVDKKAPYLTLLAFSKVVSQHEESRLIFAGDGPLLEFCEQIARSLNIYEKVIFKGSISHDEVAILMKECRAFVQHSIVPSSGDSEGTPNSILEAGASGTPVISTKHGGIKDVVVHNETGFLVEEGDIDGMANYMVKLLKEPELASKMGGKARKRIEQFYNIEDSINKLNIIIKNAN